MRMKRCSHAQQDHAVPIAAVEESNDLFAVKCFGDLLAMGGIWVPLILIGQIVMTWHVAQPVGKHFSVPAMDVVTALGVAYLLLDVVVYRVSRGRIIFQWIVPAICVAAATMTPCIIVHIIGAE